MVGFRPPHSSPADRDEVGLIFVSTLLSTAAPHPVQLTKSWAQGSTVLIGDACHPMMPNLGQGGCQAMEDGYMLTNMLKDVGDLR